MPDDNGSSPRRNLTGNGGAGGGSRPPMQRVSVWVLVGALILGWVAFRQFAETAIQTPTYGEFQKSLNNDSIVKSEPVKISDDSISWTEEGSGDQGKVTKTAALTSNFQTDELAKDLTQKGYDVEFVKPNALVGLLAGILPFVLLMFLIYWFFMRRMGAGANAALNMGRNKVKIYDRKEMKTTFADVAGVEEAKEELQEIVEFLKNPKKYQRLGGRIPKGVLLLGPPGCGKTLLARAVAGEANVPFFFMSGSEFVEMFVGLGAARVRELFQQAKEKAPALVFLDEIDTIGKGRTGAMGAGLGAHDEREQTLNQLLVEMDGFDTSKGVIIMAATNRPDVLDPALIRPGRFDRQVVVDRPDLAGREQILKVHARGVAVDPSVNLRTIAARTAGFTGADLENVINEAALLAARREKNTVTTDELEEAIDRASMGLERKSRVMSPKEKERVAFHEMGHALVALFCENVDPVHRVTIIPRGTAALGLTMVRPLEDRFLATEPELKDMLAFALGGRTAEELAYGEVSTGAQNDLEKATDIARAMVSQYGMSRKVGPLSFGHDDGNPFGGQQSKMSGQTAELIDQEVAALVNEAHDRATAILTEKRELLDNLSALLLSIESIDGDELRAYANGSTPIPDPAVAAAAAADAKAAAAAPVPPVPGVTPQPKPSRDAGPIGNPVAPPMPRLD